MNKINGIYLEVTPDNIYISKKDLDLLRIRNDYSFYGERETEILNEIDRIELSRTSNKVTFWMEDIPFEFETEEHVIERCIPIMDTNEYEIGILWNKIPFDKYIRTALNNHLKVELYRLKQSKENLEQLFEETK